MQTLTKQTLKIFIKHAAKYRWLFIFTGIGIMLANTAALIQPIFYKKFFDILSLKGSQSELIKLIIYIFIAAWIEWVFWRISTFMSAFSQSRVKSQLTITCFDYLQKHSFTFFNNHFVGSLVRKVNKYDRAFEDLADAFFWNIGNTAFNILALSIITSFFYPKIGAMIFIWCAVYVYTILALNQKILPLRIKRSEADTKQTGFLADATTNNINLKLFNGHAREVGDFSKLQKNLHELRWQVWKFALNIEAIQGALMIILEFVVMYYAITLWSKGQLSVGGFVLINSYLFVIYRRLWELGRQTTRVYEHIADANEMTEILLTPLEITDVPNAKTLKADKGNIEFKNVLFGYHEKLSVLNNFSINIKAGERVAFVGPSGGGKSTITKLLLKFYNIDSGEILIDGQNISAVTQESLWQNLSLVPQEPILFHRSLLENIRYGKPDASESEVIQASKLAHAHEFISSFPERYNTLVGERGVKLSGGERQRVAIARAILKNSPILVLDEATSSLDSESEMYIQDALKSIMSAKGGSTSGGRGKTVIVIAHRLSTIMQMDRIVVIENGKIIEQGKHQELIKMKQGMYQKLWEIQAGGFIDEK